MKTFRNLKFEPNFYGDGIRSVMEFDNGYGVSVIRSNTSYGGLSGLYELAVLKDGSLCYDTPITDDVLGWLTKDRVTEIMKQVQEL